MVTCIYCLRTLPEAEFGHDEHVLPKAFGRFRDNLTFTEARNPTVCNECNQVLGNTIDRILTRDTYEALLRIRHGVKSAEEVAQILSNRGVFQIPNGPWETMRLRLRASPDGRNVVVDLVPQVGIRRAAGDGYQFFTERELRNLHPRADRRINVALGLFLIADNDASETRLRESLALRGVTFREARRVNTFRPTEDADLTVELETRIDAVVARGIAKIALNYLAHEGGPPWALREDFNQVRRFIREGEGEWREFVRIRNEPILLGDTRMWRQTSGHLIVAETQLDTLELQVRLSPFNDRTYHVRLGRLPLFVPFEAGHFFDIRTRRVSRLGRTRLITVGLS